MASATDQSQSDTSTLCPRARSASTTSSGIARRITSYNVCYTKLLRLERGKQIADPLRIVKFRLVEQREAGSEHEIHFVVGGERATAERECAGQQLVGAIAQALRLFDERRAHLEQRA